MAEFKTAATTTTTMAGNPGCSSHAFLQVQTATCEWNDSWVCCPFLFGDPAGDVPQTSAVSHVFFEDQRVYAV